MSVVNAERVRAAARLLLDGGDITPAGARLLERMADDPDEQTQQTLDRDDLIDHIRNTVWHESEACATAEEVADGIIGRLRPMDGVVLTREEAAVVVELARDNGKRSLWAYGAEEPDLLRALAERLEAAS